MARIVLIIVCLAPFFVSCQSVPSAAQTSIIRPSNPDELARYLMVLKSPKYDTGGHMIVSELSQADVDAVQACKDAVQSGQQFPRQDKDRPRDVVNDPRLIDAAERINDCLEARHQDAMVAPSLLPLRTYLK